MAWGISQDGDGCFCLKDFLLLFWHFVALWLPDYPQTARFLDSKKRAFILERLSSAAPSGKKGEWDFGSLKVLFSDPTLNAFGLYWLCHGIGGFGVGYALPTVIYQLGFTTTTISQLMNIVSIHFSPKMTEWLTLLVAALYLLFPIFEYHGLHAAQKVDQTLDNRSRKYESRYLIVPTLALLTNI
jgi:hypothetical protein